MPRSSQRFRRILALSAIALLAVMALVVATVENSAAQSARSFVWDRYDVTIQVEEGGSLLITERFEAEFSGTPAFTYGYADIPTGRMESIDLISIVAEMPTGPVTLQEVPSVEYSRTTPWQYYTYGGGGSDFHIEYSFEPATDETRTFALTYRANGALRYYPDETPPNQQVWWIAIGHEVTDLATVRNASVTIVLPQAVPLDQVVLGEDTPGPADEHTSDGGKTWSWGKTDLDSGEDFVARVQFPPIVTADVPSWQAADDKARQEREDDERMRAILGGIGAVIGLAGLGGGGFMLTKTYREKGKDPYVGLVADVLDAPPDELPAGLVGVLIDENAETKDIVATLLDLAEKDIVELEQVDSEKFDVRLLQRPGNDIPSHERLVLNALFPGEVVGQETSLTEARKEISKKSSEIRKRMYDELVGRGYFDTSPSTVRTRWSGVGVIMMVVGIMLAVAGASVLMLQVAAIILGVATAILGLAVLIVGQGMPRKSLKGAESAARWRAFERYLREVKPFGEDSPLARDPALFERYLPYATAFGVEKDFMQRFEAANVPAPRWFVPTGYGRHGPYSGGWSSGSGGSDGGSGGGGFNMPSVQGASNRAMVSLSAASAGLSGFLNTASTAFTPPSSSGSGGGGFSGGGGGGGGGGRGFG